MNSPSTEKTEGHRLISRDQITELKPYEIFVFGSNMAGNHEAGGSLFAKMYFGAVEGCGFGLFGQSYAFPTQDLNCRSLPLEVIGLYVPFLYYTARQHPTKVFLVTQVGCGLAGYTPDQIGPLFHRHPIPPNVALPLSFWIREP